MTTQKGWGYKRRAEGDRKCQKMCTIKVRGGGDRIVQTLETYIHAYDHIQRPLCSYHNNQTGHY